MRAREGDASNYTKLSCRRLWNLVTTVLYSILPFCGNVCKKSRKNKDYSAYWCERTVSNTFFVLTFEENRLYCCLFLFDVMKACIPYFSQTGNTRKFAEAISDSLNIPAVYDITTTEPTVVNDFDLIFLGTPVHGFNPSEEALYFVERLPDGDGKRAICFALIGYGREEPSAS
jgi:hypothetical protein